MTDMTRTVEVPARFGWRLAAAAIDAVVVTFIGALVPGIVGTALAFFALAERFRSPQRTHWFVPWLAYFVLTTGLFGRTPGKMAVGIHLRGEDGRLSWAAVGLREVVGKLISAAALGLGFLWIAFDREKRGWHDVIARTRAVRTTSIPWPEQYGRDIAAALARAGEATPAMLRRIPSEHRALALRAFATRYRGDVVMDGHVLRPTGAVEWF
jgi:uncharacterized RDD family membrane protein YckC